MSIGPLPKGSRGFDCNTVITADAAARFVRAGYRFAVRYVRRQAAHEYDLSPSETATLMRAGLSLVVVQHVALPGWRPSLRLGRVYGDVAAEEAAWAGLSPGATLWCDLEDVHPDAHATDVIAYCNAWYDEVKKLGYVPGLYVGYRCGLSAHDLYYRLKFRAYWAAYNLDADEVPVVRGVQMKQSAYPPLERRVPGIHFEYDENVVTGDHLGGSPTFMLAPVPKVAA